MDRNGEFPVGDYMEAYFREPVESEFADYPEPSPGTAALSPAPELKDDKYLTGLTKFIEDCGGVCRNLQEEEKEILAKFGEGMKKEEEKRRDVAKKKGTFDDSTPAKDLFQEEIVTLRKTRKVWREMIDDAMKERHRMLESVTQRNNEMRRIRDKFRLLGRPELAQQWGIPDRIGGAGKNENNSFFWGVGALHILIMIAFIWVVKFNDDAEAWTGELSIDHTYSFLWGIFAMLIFGYGYMLVFMWKFAFGGIGMSFLLTAFIFEWGFLVLALWKNIELNHNSGWEHLTASISTVIEVLYVVAPCVISFGFLAGKVTAFEVLFVGFWEALFYGLNQYIVLGLLKCLDPGGSMVIHVFAAFFGFGLSFWMPRLMSEPGKRNQHKEIGKSLSSKSPEGAMASFSSYTQDFMALVGTVFLWIMFPGFNAALAPQGTQHRVVVNTFVALASSNVCSFLFSRAVRRRHLNIKDIRNCTFAGGIAMGSLHSFLIEPGSASLIGVVVGGLCVLFNSSGNSMMENDSPVKMFDTRGVFAVHGIAGITGGIASIVAAATFTRSSYYGQLTDDLLPRGAGTQGGYQAAGLLISLGIGLLSGLVVGFVLWLLRRSLTHPTIRTMADDRREWRVPTTGFPIPTLPHT